MARDYAALPYEYLEEMEDLSDAEFGRLCRALLRYSMAGEEVQLQGTERLFLKRIYRRERRYQENYDKQVDARREAGKKGAAARWNNMADDGKPMAKPCDRIADDGKHGKSESESESKTDILPPDGGKNTRTRDPVVADVLRDYLNRINPSASPNCLDKLAGFVHELGPEVCKRAFDIALDSKKATWPYIQAILQDKQRSGVKCLADWDELEKARSSFRETGPRPEASIGWVKKNIKPGPKTDRGAWAYVDGGDEK